MAPPPALKRGEVSPGTIRDPSSRGRRISIARSFDHRSFAICGPLASFPTLVVGPRSSLPALSNPVLSGGAHTRKGSGAVMLKSGSLAFLLSPSIVLLSSSLTAQERLGAGLISSFALVGSPLGT